MQLRLKGMPIHTLCPLILMGTIAVPSLAAATDIHTDNGWNGSWNNTVAFYNAWRATDRDPRLYTPADGASIGLPGGSAGNGTDGGTLNYAKGDQIASTLLWLSDLNLKRGDFGFRLRGKAWSDFALENHAVPYGNIANGYAKNKPLSDNGFESLNRFSGVYLLDAYVSDTFKLGEHAVGVQLGRQTIPWGESVFIQGINQVNPLDINQVRKPGINAKDLALPVFAVTANTDLGSYGKVGGFYQFLSAHSAIPTCGTYWSQLEIATSVDPGGCNAAAIVPNPLTPTSAEAYAAGFYVPLIQGPKATNGGEYGVNWRFPIEKYATELALYGMNITSRVPFIEGLSGSYLRALVPNSPLISPLAAQEKLGLTPAKGFWAYPENIHIFGLSATTKVRDIPVLRAELSYSPNTPVQRNGNDLLTAGLTGLGPLGPSALAVVVPALGGSPGQVLSGYDRFHKTQLTITGLIGAENVLGATQGNVIAETGFQWSNIPDYHQPGTLRYGRAFVFGLGSSPTYPGGTTCINGPLPPPVANPSAQGCRNDGYDTPFAWGTRLRGQLNYNNIFKSGGDFIFTLMASADVKGYSIDNQFIQGRRQYFLSGRYNYKNYGVELNYTAFGNASYDPLRDRDFYALSFTAGF